MACQHWGCRAAWGCPRRRTCRAACRVCRSLPGLSEGCRCRPAGARCDWVRTALACAGLRMCIQGLQTESVSVLQCTLLRKQHILHKSHRRHAACWCTQRIAAGQETSAHLVHQKCIVREHGWEAQRLALVIAAGWLIKVATAGAGTGCYGLLVVLWCLYEIVADGQPARIRNDAILGQVLGLAATCRFIQTSLTCQLPGPDLARHAPLHTSRSAAGLRIHV